MASNVTDPGLYYHPVSKGIRSLFYLYSPGESSFHNIHDVPLYVTKATPYFLGLIALEMLINLIRLGGKLKEPRWNDSFSSLAAGMTSQLPLLLVRNIEIGAYIMIFEKFAIYQLPWDSALTWWICMLGVDFGYYWVHRMAHEVNWMWAAHQVHHSSEDYNLTTALRQSVLQRFSSWMFYLPMAFFVPPAIFVVHLQLNLLYQFWIHTETVGRLPAPIEYIFNTASHHRVHHGRNRYCIDKNYAGVLIIWDRMFGTFVPEDDNDEIAYGLVHPLNSWDPFFTQFHHWQFILKRAWKDKKYINKFWRFWKGPGWRPGKPRLGVHEDLPDVHGKQPKYDSKVTPLWQNLYLWLHFGIALLAQQIIGENRQDFSSLSIFLMIIFIMCTLTNIGYFYDRRWYAPFLEVLRCAVYLAVDSYACGSGTCSTMLYGIKMCYVFSIGIWGIQCLIGSSVSVDVKQKKND